MVGGSDGSSELHSVEVFDVEVNALSVVEVLELKYYNRISCIEAALQMVFDMPAINWEWHVDPSSSSTRDYEAIVE